MRSGHHASDYSLPSLTAPGRRAVGCGRSLAIQPAETHWLEGICGGESGSTHGRSRQGLALPACQPMRAVWYRPSHELRLLRSAELGQILISPVRSRRERTVCRSSTAGLAIFRMACGSAIASGRSSLCLPFLASVFPGK